MNKFYLKTLLLCLFSFAGMARTLAHDIAVANVDGVTIYYNYHNNKTELQVTYRGSSSTSYSDEYSGNVVIPEIVTYDGETYRVTSIKDEAFYRCFGLKSVTIPNSVTSIGERAFEYCTGLKSVVFPESVRSIGSFAFLYCSGLEKVIVKDIAKWCEIYFGIDSSNPLNYAGHLYSDEDTEITDLIIPNGVTRIRDYTFRGCSGLTSVTIPESVASIGYAAFRECNHLTSVIIPNSVTSIGNYAFYHCGLIICNRATPPSADSNSFTSAAIVPYNLISQYKNAWKNISIYSPFEIVSTTQSTITLKVNGQPLDAYVLWGETKYTPVDNTVTITGLSPDKQYGISTYTKYGNIEFNDEVIATTRTIYMSLRRTSATNLTIKVQGSYSLGDAEDLTVTGSGFVGHGKGDEITIQGLQPGKSYDIQYYVTTSDGRRFTTSNTLSTLPVTVTAYVDAIGPSHCTLRGSYSVIDATVTECGFADSIRHNIVTITGLDPIQTYQATFYVETKEGGRVTTDVSYATTALSMTTSQPKVVSLGNVIVSAETNLDDNEDNVGFEWRRTDWTNDFDSNTGDAFLYNGTMEGYIRNLNTEKLWKYRPYYVSNSGRRYYGEWVGLDPTNTSYFEPTVHTYASVNVNGNTASVKGYAMTGTDKIASQGFKFWKGETAEAKSLDAPQKAASIPSDAMTMEASGQVMTADLTGLDYNSAYHYVAFVTTSEGETFYGEEQMFETGDDPTGIEGIETKPSEQKPVTIVARYNINGQQISSPQKGINILRMSDGTVRKVLVK